ncbi:putative HD phosphohydrolase [Cytobacillus horneckiae]|uniref:hypothetical protein n=1 Tax=Cytobacillus horneckiae TaxID=549687 RepID=UPI0019D274E3|nr:hypothetical protein [Cytobacillus horneckiae]MBN6886992.1 hypothetical protein [Cytobacillus horneckiae]
MTVKELEIIVAALEHDLTHQYKSQNKDHPAFVSWREETEKLLKKKRRELSALRSIKV